MCGRGVDPVELVGQGQELEFFQSKVELPGVRNKVEKVWRGSHRPGMKSRLLLTIWNQYPGMLRQALGGALMFLSLQNLIAPTFIAST